MDSKDVMLLLLGALIGAVLELLLALLFEDKARFYFRRIGRIYHGLRARLANPQFGYQKNLFQIGKWIAPCYVIEGFGGKYYSAYNISATIDQNPLELPEDLQTMRGKIEAQQKEIERAKGQPKYYNGPMVALKEYQFSRTRLYEDALLHLRFQLTDYYTFLATAIHQHDVLPGGATIYDKYLSNRDFQNPNPLIATSFGVNLSIITRDNFLMIGKRGHGGISHYRDLFQVPICESVNPKIDIEENDPGKIDLYKTAIRGAKEELGMDVSRAEVRFFSLCVDIKYYLYGMTGVIRTENYTRDDFISRRSIGTQDKYETSDIEFLPLDLRYITEQLKLQGGPDCWHPASFVATVQTLINEFGVEKVEKNLKRINP